MRRSSSPRLGSSRGFTAVEVIVAVAVLAVAVLPVFMSTTAGSRMVRLTEFHVIAQTRAKRLLEAFSTYGLEELRALAPAGGPLPAPFTDSELDGAGFDLPPEYRRKMENFQEAYRFELLGPDLGMVEVTLTWKIRGVEHDYRLFRLFGSTHSSTAPSLGLGGP